MSQTLLGNPKRPVELGHSNICPKIKCVYFLLILAQEIVCRETAVF